MTFTYTCKYCGHTIHQEGSWNGYCAWCGRYLEGEMFDKMYETGNTVLKLLIVGASIFIILLYSLILFMINSFSLINLGIGIVVCAIVAVLIWLSL